MGRHLCDTKSVTKSNPNSYANADADAHTYADNNSKRWRRRVHTHAYADAHTDTHNNTWWWRRWR